jgi:hypothetical protein
MSAVLDFKLGHYRKSRKSSPMKTRPPGKSFAPIETILTQAVGGNRISFAQIGMTNPKPGFAKLSFHPTAC